MTPRIFLKIMGLAVLEYVSRLPPCLQPAANSTEENLLLC
jgi:hypothetical protein